MDNARRFACTEIEVCVTAAPQGFPKVPKKTEYLDKCSINIDILTVFFGPQGMA